MHFDVDNDGAITAHDIATLFDIEYAHLPKTDLGKSFTEILVQEAEERKQFEEDRLAALKKEQAEQQPAAQLLLPG